jgi:Flp pilus assembly protein TadD
MVVACGIFLGACLVLTWQQINYWNGSVALFSRAVALHPSDAKAQDLLGVAYNDAGEYDAAEAHFAVAARLHPRNADFQYNLGRALMDEQRFAEATEPLAAAVALRTDDETWRNTLAADLMMSGEPHEAEKVLSQAIAQQPQFSMSYYNLGIVQLNEQEAPSAITNFLMAVKLQPDWPEALARLAGAYAAAGDFSNAVSSASLALTQAQANQETELAGQMSAELNSFQASYNQQSHH